VRSWPARGLIGQQVPDSGDLGLVEQAGLDRDRPLHDQVPEFRLRDLLRVRAERVEVRIKPDAPQPALVEQGQAAAVGEDQREAVPLVLAGLRVATARPAALERLAVRGRDDDAAAHAQVDTEVRAGRGRGTGPGGRAPYRLAAPARGGEHAPGQRGAQLAGGVRPAHVRVGVINVRDAPVQRVVGDEAAGGLDFGKFWHAPVLLAGGSSGEFPPVSGLRRGAEYSAKLVSLH
jgi:hypothetical protein